LLQLLALAALASAAALGLGAGSAFADSSYLCTGVAATDTPGLQADLNGGGTVTVLGPLPCVGNWTVNNDVTIVGGTPGATLNGNATGSVLTVTGAFTLTVRNLRITNGAGVDGGGIDDEFCGSTVNLSNAVVTGNTASDSGGGVFVDCATLNVTASTISNNTAPVGGGIFAVFDATVNVTNSSVTGNTASEAGGGIAFGLLAFLNLTGATFSRNSAGFDGGGIYGVDEAFLNGTASTISSNSAGSAAVADGEPLESFGGGIAADFAFVTLTSTHVSGNTISGFGGGIFFQDGGFLLDGGALPAVVAPSGHAGHFPHLSLPLVKAPKAGVVPNQPPIMASGLNLINSTVDHNTAQVGAGGGIGNDSCEFDSPVTMSGTTVSINRSTGDTLDALSGGGGYVQYGNDCENDTSASLVATNSQFGGNTAKSSVGGAILNVNTPGAGAALVTLAQTPVMRLPMYLNDNQAGWGGGIFNFGDGANTTLQAGGHVIHNQAFFNGGGVFNDCDAR
jgi:predicted outer membrane repeat protein